MGSNFRYVRIYFTSTYCPSFTEPLNSDVNRSSVVNVKIYDERDSGEQDPAVIGEVEVDITHVFKSPLNEERLSYLLMSPKIYATLLDSSPHLRFEETQQFKESRNVGDVY